MKTWWKASANPVNLSDELVKAHMTFAKTTIGQRLKRTGTLFRQQLWIWPILAIAVLILIGYSITHSIQSTMQANLKSGMTALLHLERTLVEKWLTRQESIALTLANDHQLRTLVLKLLANNGEVKKPSDGASIDSAPPAPDDVQLASQFGPTMSVHDFSGYLITDREHRIVASNNPELLGQEATQYEKFLSKVIAGKAAVCPPFASMAAIKDERGRIQTGVPTMFVSVPVRDENFQVVAALSLRIAPEREFTHLIQTGRMGDTGETYAFDAKGHIISNSRFESELILLGLIPDKDNTTSILQLQLKDPGGNMQQGFRPRLRRGELPLTKNVETAIAGNDGIDLSGYRNYRGIESVGAWTWLPEYAFGLAIEIELAEAFEPLNILKRAFYILYFLLALSSVAIFIFTLVVARLQREARDAAIEAKQLGQYRLEERLGEGAMGIVYKGHHAMLRRPSAIKLLNTDRVNEASITRFEREVQITCNLNNPHTVAIYDYGRTPEGIFYYAMEYLDGVDLQNLVDRYGPQVDGRVAKIIDQLCSSLFEAHSSGLVHRDIKPANVMLNRRGGEPDFVKLLDFGLVKAVDDSQRGKSGDGLAGTPLYMSPESIQAPDLVDARSDLYAVGAVAYFLLTGAPVFQAKTLGELCQAHIDAVPITPSARIGRTVDPDLEHAILMCLEKNRAKRPQTARELSAKLRRLCATDSWSIIDAEAWWSRHERGVEAIRRAQSGQAALDTSFSGSSLSNQRSSAPKESVFDQTIDHSEPRAVDQPIDGSAPSIPTNRPK